MIQKLVRNLIFLLIVPAITFASGTVMSGAVMDAQAHPLEGAAVTIHQRGNSSDSAENQVRQLTSSSGVFMFQDISEGDYDVTCKKEGFESQTKTVSVKRYNLASVYFLLNPINVGSMQPLSEDVFHVGNVDLESARVFVAFASDQPQSTTINNGLNGDFPVQAPYSDSPYSTMNEMGAMLYGGNPMKDNPLMQLMLHNGASNPSMLIQATHPNSISLLDAKTENVVAAIPTSSRPFWLAFSPDGKRLWLADEMHNLTMYSNRGERMASVNVGENIVTDMAVSPYGDRVYLAIRSADPEILVADGVSNSLVGSFSLSIAHGEPGGVAMSLDGRRLVVTTGTPTMGWLEVLDPGSGQILEEIQVGQQPLGVGITPDGSRAVVANYSSSYVDLVDLQKGVVIAQIPTGLQPSKIAMRSDGRVAFVTNNGDNSLSVIDVANGVVLAKVPVGKGPMGVAVTRDGTRIYVANNDSGDVSIIDGITLAVVKTTTPMSGLHPYGIAVRP